MEAKLDVRKLRDELRMTQAQLASEVGVDQSTVSLWETGHSRPRGPALKLLTFISLTKAQAETASGVAE